MTDERNKHGLSRKIPRPVAREVRQQCGHGCVICGRLPYQYDHFDPEFVDATEHRADRIALLCPTHHTERTSKRLFDSVLAPARISPANRKGDAVWPLLLGKTGDLTLVACGNRFTFSDPGLTVGIKLNDEVIFGLGRDTDGSWLLSGSFSDDEGRETLEIVDNELTIRNGTWDVTLEGKLLTVRRASHKIVLELEFDNSGVISLNRLAMSRSDWTIRGGVTTIEFSSANTKFSFGNNSFSSNRGAKFAPETFLGAHFTAAHGMLSMRIGPSTRRPAEILASKPESDAATG